MKQENPCKIWVTTLCSLQYIRTKLLSSTERTVTPWTTLLGH